VKSSKASLLAYSNINPKLQLLVLASLPSISFSLITFHDCDFNNFILYGAFNIVVPLASAWLALMYVMYKFYPNLTKRSEESIRGYEKEGCARIVRTHPIVLGVLSGGAYWIGNTGEGERGAKRRAFRISHIIPTRSSQGFTSGRTFILRCGSGDC